MENKNQAAQPQEAHDEKALTSKKTIKGVAYACAALVVVCAIAIGWYTIDRKNAEKADDAIGQADIEYLSPALFGSVGNDSIALEKYMAAAEAGHKSGDRAALQSAIMLYQKKDYEKAIEYLDKASSSSSIIEAGRYTLMGDCYANLGQLDKAKDAFRKAYSAADKNPQIAPFILVKEANIYRELKDYKAEYNAYETVIYQYPAYYNQLVKSRIDLRKYAERAKASMENK